MKHERLNLTAPVDWKLADEKVSGGQRRYAMLAYAGTVADIGFGPFVIDLATLSLPRSAPTLRQHDFDQFVGRADRLAVEDRDGGACLAVEGFLFDTDEGQKVARMSDQGAEWQASVGIRFDLESVEFVDKGATLSINGRTLAGPFLAIRNASLKEVSFVPLGADPNTAAVTLADAISARLNLNTRNTKGAPVADENTERKPASVRDLRAAFQNDPEYALDAAERGLSLLEAKAEYADKLVAKLTAERTAREKAEAKLAQASKAPKPSPAGAISGGTGDVGGSDSDPIAEFNAALAAETDRLLKLGSAGLHRQGIVLSREANVRALALDNVARRNPDLHRAYLEAHNANLPARQGR